VECYVVIPAQSEGSYTATDDQYSLCVFTFQKFYVASTRWKHDHEWCENKN